RRPAAALQPGRAGAVPARPGRAAGRGPRPDGRGGGPALQRGPGTGLDVRQAPGGPRTRSTGDRRRRAGRPDRAGEALGHPLPARPPVSPPSRVTPDSSPALVGMLAAGAWFGLFAGSQLLVLHRWAPPDRARVLLIGYGLSVVGLLV